MKLKYFLLLIIHEFFGTAEQVILKRGINGLEKPNFKSFKDCLIFVRNILITPLIWVGFLLILAAWIFWFTVLAGVDLSIAMPVDSLQYVMIMVASYFFLHERMNWKKIGGVVFIIAGVIMVASS